MRKNEEFKRPTSAYLELSTVGIVQKSRRPTVEKSLAPLRALRIALVTKQTRSILLDEKRSKHDSSSDNDCSS
eukprot:scaffold22233_cov129-Skeletonema_dohrnii-CCMP3373.AAC.1